MTVATTLPGSDSDHARSAASNVSGVKPPLSASAGRSCRGPRRRRRWPIRQGRPCRRRARRGRPAGRARRSARSGGGKAAPAPAPARGRRRRLRLRARRRRWGCRHAHRQARTPPQIVTALRMRYRWCDAPDRSADGRQSDRPTPRQLPARGARAAARTSAASERTAVGERRGDVRGGQAAVLDRGRRRWRSAAGSPWRPRRCTWSAPCLSNRPSALDVGATCRRNEAAAAERVDGLRQRAVQIPAPGACGIGMSHTTGCTAGADDDARGMQSTSHPPPRRRPQRLLPRRLRGFSGSRLSFRSAQLTSEVNSVAGVSNSYTAHNG